MQHPLYTSNFPSIRYHERNYHDYRYYHNIILLTVLQVATKIVKYY